MKVLIITYYWPPAGGGGVQRWLKFAKYLPDFEIEPIIYTVKNPNYPIEDKSLCKEVSPNITVLQHPIFEPTALFSFFKGKKPNTSAGFIGKKKTLFTKFIHYIRANFFIPDSRMFWIQPSIKTLTKYLNKNPVDWVISTGPPHSTHLIAMELKKRFPCKWLADFRDPWCEIDYFHHLPLTHRSKRKHQTLETKVVKTADTVVCIGKTMAKKFLPINPNTIVIPNGFDDFDKPNTSIQNKPETFTITYIGQMNEDRNPLLFWQTLHQLNKDNASFKRQIHIQLIGTIAPEIFQSIKEYHLQQHTTHIPNVPHKELASYQQNTTLLLLIVNDVPNKKGIVTGKVFEYLNTGKPIIAIAPKDGDLAEIINETNAGKVFDYTDNKELYDFITHCFLNKEDLCKTFSSTKHLQYHRRNLTKQLANTLRVQSIIGSYCRLE